MGAPNVEEINYDYLTENNFLFKLDKTVDKFEFSVCFWHFMHPIIIVPLW